MVKDMGLHFHLHCLNFYIHINGCTEIQDDLHFTKITKPKRMIREARIDLVVFTIFIIISM